MLSWAAWGKITPTWSEKVFKNHKWRSSKRLVAHSSYLLRQFFKRMKKSLSIKVKQRNCDGLKLSRYIGKGGLRFRGSLIFPPLSLSRAFSSSFSHSLPLSHSLTHERDFPHQQKIYRRIVISHRCREKKKFRPPRWGRNFFWGRSPGTRSRQNFKTNIFYSGGGGAQ